MTLPVDIMIDLETLSLQSDAAILSIGACTFKDLAGVDTKFYARIGRAYYTAYPYGNFHIDEGTLAWWSKQSQEARYAAFEGNTSLLSSLHNFTRFCNQFETVRVWGNAASFDLKILEHAYKVFNMPTPWNYKGEMCYRTLKNLFPRVPYTKPELAHDALSDAIAQKNHAVQILELCDGIRN